MWEKIEKLKLKSQSENLKCVLPTNLYDLNTLFLAVQNSSMGDLVPWLPPLENTLKTYMEKRTSVAEKAILAKKKLAEKVRKSRQNLA